MYSFINYEKTINYINELAEKKVPVFISTSLENGKMIMGEGRVYGHTTIIRDGMEKKVVILGLGNDLNDAFGMALEPFVFTVSLLYDEDRKHYHKTYIDCINSNRIKIM